MQTKLIVVVALVSGFATSHAMADSLGRFTRPSTGTTVDFFDCGGNLCGKIVAVKDASHKSEVGKMIVNGAKPSGASSWKGDLFDPESGKTYGGSIALVSGGLKLQGCVMGFLCSGEVWTRVK
jgi:uncharacterized protein (DUF2147 family)